MSVTVSALHSRSDTAAARGLQKQQTLYLNAGTLIRKWCMYQNTVIIRRRQTYHSLEIRLVESTISPHMQASPPSTRLFCAVVPVEIQSYCQQAYRQTVKVISWWLHCIVTCGSGHPSIRGGGLLSLYEQRDLWFMVTAVITVNYHYTLHFGYNAPFWGITGGSRMHLVKMITSPKGATKVPAFLSII